jgi:hypothetical protein
MRAIARLELGRDSSPWSKGSHDGVRLVGKGLLRCRRVGPVQLASRLAGIPPIHHFLAVYSCRDKSTSFMQRPYDHDFYAGNKICTGLTWVDQTKEGIRPISHVQQLSDLILV